VGSCSLPPATKLLITNTNSSIDIKLVVQSRDVVSVEMSRSRDSLKTVSRRTNVSSRSRVEQNPQRLGLGLMHLGSRLDLGAICLGLGSVGLISGLGPWRLVETFCASVRRAHCNWS